MDTNEITCPKCGHLNNYISEGCVKCGIIFSKYFEMQDQQPEMSTAEVIAEPGKENEIFAADSPQISESVIPATAPADDKAQVITEISQSVPEIPAPIEVKPEETQPQPVSEISVGAIEMPFDALAEKPEEEQPIAPETPAFSKQEPTIEMTEDKTADPESLTDAVSVQTEVQTPAQTSVQAIETQVTEQAPAEPGSPLVIGETAAPATDVVEPVETVKPQTEAKPMFRQ